MINKISIVLILLLILSSCASTSNNKAQIPTKNRVNITPPIDNEFPSLLRPNKITLLGENYIDTVKYIDFNDDGDEWIFLVEKNKDTIGLIYNKKQKISLDKGDEITINWRIDSLRYAGDSEFLHYKEFLNSIKLN